jgi:hypothetical protein
MTRFNKIRHHCLREAVAQLSYEPAMQAQPFLLAFLQNLVECINQDAIAHKQLESEVRVLRERLNRLTREEMSR